MSKSSERAAGKVGRQGWTGARDKRKKAPAPPQGISQGVCSLGEIIDACSGWSMCNVYFQLHRTERHRQRHVKKADNLVKKVAVCLTNRDQSDDKNMIGIGINI